MSKSSASSTPHGAQHRVDLEHAEAMGWAAGRYGPNETNCDFRLFSAPEFTKAWEDGNIRGKHDKFMEENRSA